MRFADLPVAGPSAHGAVEEKEGDGASVVSNPPVVDKTWLGLLLLFTMSIWSLVRCLLLRWLCIAALSQLYVHSVPVESTRPLFCLYPRVREILADVRDHADTLAKTTKPLSAIFPRRRRSHSVADVADFTDFLRLAENKSISTKQAGTISFEMEWMENSTLSLLEANSYSLWLLLGSPVPTQAGRFCSV